MKEYEKSLAFDLLMISSWYVINTAIIQSLWKVKIYSTYMHVSACIYLYEWMFISLKPE